MLAYAVMLSFSPSTNLTHRYLMNKPKNVLTSIRTAHEVIRQGTNDSDIINLHWSLMWFNFVLLGLIIN